MAKLKVIIEKHADGFVAYPVGLKGVIVAEGDTYDEALTNVRSAIRFHVDTFGKDAVDLDSPAEEVFVADTGVDV